MTSKDRLQTAFLVFLVTISLYLNFSLIDAVKQIKEARAKAKREPYMETVRPEDSWSYIGEDHPERLPVERKLVKMLVQESVRYSIMQPEANMEWLWTGPLGDHAVRLGSEKRGYTISMFHQLHCLRILRENLAENQWPRLSSGAKGHIHHCFNYLRNWSLCSADVTLEPGDFAQRNFTMHRTGATHTCRDWEPVYDKVNEAWDSWEEYRITRGVPPQNLG